MTPMHVAALNGHAVVVRLLASERASVHVVEKQRLQPIHMAAKSGHKDSPPDLLSFGKQNNQKCHLMFWACFC